MSIIKLKKEEGTKAEELKVETDVVEASVAEENVITEKYSDSAILYEDKSNTDEHSRHYILNNGTAKSVFSSQPINYYDEEKKEWEAIDNTLEEKADMYESKGGRYSTRVSKVGSGRKVSVTDNSNPYKSVTWEYLGKEGIVSYAMEGRDKTELTIKNKEERSGSEAIYKNVEKDTDLEYSIRGNGIKENIIVRKKSGSYRYVFELKAKGLKVRLSEDNESLELYSEQGNKYGGTDTKMELRIPSPYMYDAKGETSEEVYYEVETKGEGYKFTVVASEEWINAEGREFPVTIDPQIVTNQSNLITKQVQYKYSSSSSSSGYSNGWTNTWMFNDIKVYNDYYSQYRTCLTIKKSLMKLPYNRISSVKLILTPSNSFGGSVLVNGSLYQYNSANGLLECNITEKFKETNGDFEIYIEPANEYIDGYFSYYSDPPTVEVEYLTGEENIPAKKTFEFAGGTVGEVNLATGDMVMSFEDVPAESSAGKLSIRHVYKRGLKNYRIGDRYGLNLDETFVKNGQSSLDANYVYTDSMGDKHGFKDYYYYINSFGEKIYIPRELKANIEADVDGTLKYEGYEAFAEYKSASGLKAITRLENLKNIYYLEQRSDEEKQLDEKIESYINIFKEFVTINASDGSERVKLEQNSFDYFVSDAAKKEVLLVTKDEAMAYRSLLIQKKSLKNQKDSLECQREESEYSKKSMEKQKEEEIKKDEGNKEKSLITKLTDQIAFTVKQIENIDNSLTNNEEQLTQIDDQIKYYAGKKVEYTKTLRKYNKEYKSVVNQKEDNEYQTPLNFLTDGKIFKGYNSVGKLVAIYDSYENYVIIKYEKYYSSGSSGRRIAYLYDNDDKTVTFKYTPDNKLASITDINGNKTSYKYTDSKLTAIYYDTKGEVDLSYKNNNIVAITDQKNKLKTVISYTVDKPASFKNYSLAENIHNGTADDSETLLNEISLTFNQKTDWTMDYVTIKENNTKEKYCFDTNNNLKDYYLEESGVVSEAERYEYQPYWSGSVKQDDPMATTTYAKKSTLYLKGIESYSFEAGDTEKTELNQFNEAESAVITKYTDNNKKEVTTINYVYDDTQKLTEEISTVERDDKKQYTTHKKYTYNESGNVVRTESYVEGEEYTNGKIVSETEYDKKGNVVKSYSYNTLDASSKFYSETEYADDGKVKAEYDETGENKKEYRYANNKEEVSEEILPDGSKFAYGRDYDGTVTSITQSTEEGEENSTQKVYRYGEVVELRSGNNTVKYTYDGKRRVTKVGLNGEEAYATTEYVDGSEKDVIKTKYVSRSGATGKEDVFEITKNKRGDVISSKYTGFNNNASVTESYTNEYDNRNRISKVKKGEEVSERYSYDSSDRVEKHVFGSKVHGITYNDLGQVTSESLQVGANEYSYKYEYNEDSNHRLKKMSVGNVTEEYEYDVNGRRKAIKQTVGKTEYTKRYGYSKTGDHATNRVNVVYNSKNGITDGKTTYTYDKLGNITSINENGKQHYQYEYDKLCRLISEKDLYNGNEVCYTYDNQGNILTKSVNGTTTEYRYSDGTDKLMYYGNEAYEYDKLGNPTKYRDLTCEWEKGRQLKGISYDENNSITFGYDIYGIRTKKAVKSKDKESAAYYIYENGKLLRELCGATSIDYIYGTEGIAGFVVDKDTNNEATYVYRKNIFGDVTAVYNDDGILQCTYEYDAWGNHVIYDADGKVVDGNSDNIGLINPIRYRGYYFDEETGLYYLKTRYYDPQVGRFMTIDGIEYLDPETINGLNLYAYCNNNPVMNVDPDGNKWWHWLIGAIVIIGLGVATIATAGIAGVGIGTAFAAGFSGAAIGIGASGFAVTVASSAFAGAVISAGIGLISGGILGAVETGTWKGVIEGAAKGFMIGSISGAVSGGFHGAINFVRTTPLIRTVSTQELNSIRSSGSFSSTGSMESKWFATNKTNAAQWAKSFDQSDYVGIRVLKSSLKNNSVFYQAALDRIGAAYCIEIEYLNKIIHSMWLF